MPDMPFHSPTTVAQALDAAATLGPAARWLAGGSDLIVQMRSRRVEPTGVIDLKRIAEMHGVREHDGGFEIGAATPCLVLGSNEA